MIAPVEGIIERVARAIARAEEGNPQGFTEDDWRAYIATARAAIQAMRTPSRDMIQAGITAIDDAHDETRDSFGTYMITNGSDYALPGWEAMIDAAMKEP